MPIFIKNKLVFIHIPKTGGTSIVRTMENDLNDKVLYYNENPFSVDDHTPQHSSYLELRQRKLIPEGFDIVAVVRNPYDRFLSEYGWVASRKTQTYDLNEFAFDFFESALKRNTWDNHEKSQLYFLKGGLSIINVIRFEALPDFFLTKYTVPLRKENVSQRKGVLTDYARKLIGEHWREDFLYFGFDL